MIARPPRFTMGEAARLPAHAPALAEIEALGDTPQAFDRVRVWMEQHCVKADDETYKRATILRDRLALKFWGEGVWRGREPSAAPYTTCLITDADGITRRLSYQIKVF